ncbi:MAG: class I SAM-dependent methyltransferase [Rhabdochlamydiaceae bacterium]
MRPKDKGLKLHLGCGDYWFEGYINIDINVYGGTDMLWDIRKGLPFQNEVVEIIEAYEVVEHFNKYEIDEILKDWYRVLIPGGIVKIGLPDMDGLIALYATDKANAIQQIYGIEDHPHHKQGYTVETLTKLFEDHRFQVKSCDQGVMENRPNEPKLLLEAIKI